MSSSPSSFCRDAICNFSSSTVASTDQSFSRPQTKSIVFLLQLPNHLAQLFILHKNGHENDYFLRQSRITLLGNMGLSILLGFFYNL